MRPGLWAAVVLLFVAGLGCAYMPGYDRRLLAAAPDDLRGRSLAMPAAGLMFAQGVGFVLWGLMAELVSPRLVIPAAAVCGLVAVAFCYPRTARAAQAGPTR